MDFSTITQQMLILLALMVVGYGASRLGYMNPPFNKAFSGFIINVATPAMILHSVMVGDRALGGTELLILLALSALSYVLVILLSLPARKLPGSSCTDAGLFRFMIVFSNTGFMGFPVVIALLGESALFYAAMFNILFNLLVYSYGIRLISGGAQGGFDRKTLLSPCFLATALSLVIYFTNLPIPAVAVETLDYLSGITVPGSMVIIGATLATIPIKSVFTEWRVYVIAAVKLILLPALMWALLYFLPINPIISQIIVIMWSLPVAAVCTMLSTQYGGDETMAAKGVLITTVLSVLTIPLMMHILF